MRLDKFLAADEHAARSTAGIVDAALIGSEHLNQHAYHARRRIELPAAFALGAGEARQKVLVHAAERVLGSVGGAAQCNVAHQIDNLSEALLIEAGAAEIFRQHALQRWIVALDR